MNLAIYFSILIMGGSIMEYWWYIRYVYKANLILYLGVSEHDLYISISTKLYVNKGTI